MSFRPVLSRLVLATAASLALAHAAVAAPVYANNSGGDAFVGPNASPGTGQAIGATGWYYNNVRDGGTVGIDGTYARSGNGSASMGGAAGTKADVEYLGNAAVNVGGIYRSMTSLGKFTDLTSMSFDWYRDASSGADSHLHPSLRVLLDMDGDLSTTGDRGGLVYERAYNPAVSAVPTDAWQTDTVNSTTKLWNFGLGLGNEYNIDGIGSQYDDLSIWQASGRMANAVIVGFSSGFGSGWSGTFLGAVDNIAWNIAGVATTSNFEIQAAAVPEPGSLALVALALAGLGLATRRQQRKG